MNFFLFWVYTYCQDRSVYVYRYTTSLQIELEFPGCSDFVKNSEFTNSRILNNVSTLMKQATMQKTVSISQCPDGYD